jgi:hypothetical protein
MPRMEARPVGVHRSTWKVLAGFACQNLDLEVVPAAFCLPEDLGRLASSLK